MRTTGAARVIDRADPIRCWRKGATTTTASTSRPEHTRPEEESARPPTHRSQLSLDDNLLCANGDENLRQAGPRFVRSKRCANPQPKAAGLCMEGS
jgi:hypothetical protein